MPSVESYSLTGNAAKTFAFNHRVTSQHSLIVEYTPDDLVTANSVFSVVSTALYTVSGIGNDSQSVTIRYDAAADADGTLRITVTEPSTSGKQTDYTTSGAATGKNLNDDFDYLHTLRNALDAVTMQQSAPGASFSAENEQIEDVLPGDSATDAPNLSQVLSILGLNSTHLNAAGKKITNLAVGAATSTDADRVIDREAGDTALQGQIDGHETRLDDAETELSDARAPHPSLDARLDVITAAIGTGSGLPLIGDGTPDPDTTGKLLSNDGAVANWTDTITRLLKYLFDGLSGQFGGFGQVNVYHNSAATTDRHYIALNCTLVPLAFPGTGQVTQLDAAKPVIVLELRGGAGNNTRFAIWSAPDGATGVVSVTNNFACGHTGGVPYLTSGGDTIWTSGNDGADSGLNADTVDGSHASALLARANHTGTQAAATISDFVAEAQDAADTQIAIHDAAAAAHPDHLNRGIRAYRAETLAILNNTLSNLTWDAEVNDAFSIFTPGGFSFALGENEIWLVTLSVAWQYNVTGTRTVNIYGGSIRIAQQVLSAAVAGTVVQNLSVIYNTGEGANTIRVGVEQNSGGNLNILDFDSGFESHISLVRLYKP